MPRDVAGELEFAEIFESQRGEDVSVRVRRPRGSPRTLRDADPFRHKGSPVLRRARQAVGRLMGYVGTMVLSGPVVVIVSVMLEKLSDTGEAFVVIYVTLVALFFGLLNVFVITSGIEWLYERVERIRTPFDRHGRLRAPWPAAGTTLRGRLRQLGPAPTRLAGMVLWREGWFFPESSPHRLCVGDHLLLEIEAEPGSASEGEVVVLELGTAPVVIVTPRTGAITDFSPELRDETVLLREEGLIAELREGMLVEVVVPRPLRPIDNLEHVELADGVRRVDSKLSGPYRGRGRRRGQLAISEAGARIWIRALEG